MAGSGGKCALVLIFLTSGTRVTSGARIPVELSVFLPLSGHQDIGKYIYPAANMAADDVNNEVGFLANHVLRLSFYDTGCDEGRAFVKLVAVFRSGSPIHGIIGPGCDAVCEPFGVVASDLGLPLVSWGCHSVLLLDKVKHSTLARTVASRQNTILVIFAMLRHYRWQRIGILFVAHGKWARLAGALRKTFKEKNGGFVRDIHTIHAGMKGMSDTDRKTRWAMLKHIVMHLRILILCMGAGDVRDMILSAKKQNLLTGEYIFIVIDFKAESIYGINTWMGDDGRDDEAIEAFQGVLNIRMTKPDNEEYRQFEAKVIKAANETDANGTRYDGSEQPLDIHAGNLHDAVMLYAHALNKALSHGYDVNDGRHVANYLFNTTFEGKSGIVSIDEFGDNIPSYGVLVYEGDAFKTTAFYSYKEDQIVPKTNVTVVFPGGGTTAPRDSPQCGWDNEYCVTASYDNYLAISLPFLAVLLLIIISSALVYRKIKFELEVNSEQLWRIKPEELTICRHSYNKGSRLSITSRSVGDFSTQEVFAEVAVFKGVRVCLTKITEQAIVFNRQMRLALKQVKDIHHENVNTLMGMCVDEPLRRLVTSYCSRGSLSDVLDNDDVRISDDFKLSFSMDICKGMEYLHKSSVEFHGRLKSSNCVVDNRWTCMITDYGISDLRRKRQWTDDQYWSLLWTAPELLHVSIPPTGGSKSADVYAYGIIIQEIAIRDRPYGMVTDKLPKDIIDQVMATLTPAYRPIVNADSCPSYMIILMEKCWQETADNRPTFTDVKNDLKTANNNKSINILDNMIEMMEQYANHLEDIVYERTQLLEDEKRKTDQLLYEMLPKPIAEDLKLGRVIHPKNYDKSTVYFSDVVGFADLASQSAPLEIVDLLNDLYTTFDNIIDNYDVYKVETTDDAYMVVSGVPIVNGNTHAAHVASLALDTLSSVTSFRISHMPDTQLRLRIGIHSGAVVAGVIGLKMPRYCLFGDTVNTASRMMSNGAPLRIHMSKSTSDLLEEIGGYDIEKRGEIQVKGKGLLTTYWLLGKDGFDKPLPDYC